MNGVFTVFLHEPLRALRVAEKVLLMAANKLLII